MKLDESMPHLRAAAVIYADALADGLRLYLCDEAFDYRKLLKTTPQSPLRGASSPDKGRLCPQNKKEKPILISLF